MYATAPLLFIMCGLPFSGKSTVAHHVSAQLRLPCVAIDEINTQRGIGLHGDAITAADWETTYALSFRELEHHLRSGQSVIHDATNFTREQRDALRQIADGLGASSVVIYVGVPESVVRQRWLTNRIARERKDVRDDDLLNVVESFEVPTNDEGRVIVYDGSLPIGEWFDTALLRAF